MKKKRNHARQTTSLQDRLAVFARGLAEMAATMPAGAERDNLLKRARTAEIAADIDDWVSSAGLQPPTP
ncbi:hypothetical protein ACVIHH_000086 [Bradyrhizobium sp. USDA 4518]|uniref:hypothetical protein n=1 Tax=unclassified Bradyrhizobium TaxID=2631580 RepID=UPI00209DA0D2|nr:MULTISPECIES: hypothetical protein [unclassified Bradyrhizobium]MCP1835323.1 hypothetical protein [Bradyrhizobium sp. USDA 4545]MCP1920069.1 hypothetical protein [Bradyrhizobium sp. USDA 4532]